MSLVALFVLLFIAIFATVPIGISLGGATILTMDWFTSMDTVVSAQLGISRTQSIEHFPFALFFTFSMALSRDKRDVFFACLQVFLQILQLVQSGGFFHPLLYCLQLLFPFQKPHKVYSIPARFFRLPAGIDPTLISVHHYLEQHSWIDLRFPSFRRIGPIHKSVLCRRK